MEESITKLIHYLTDVRVKMQKASTLDEAKLLCSDYLAIFNVLNRYFKDDDSVAHELIKFTALAIKLNIDVKEICFSMPTKKGMTKLVISESMASLEDKYVEKIFRNLSFPVYEDEHIDEIIKAFVSKENYPLAEIYQQMKDERIIKLPRLEKDDYVSLGATVLPQSKSLEPLIFIKGIQYLENTMITLHELAHIYQHQRMDRNYHSDLNIEEIYPKVIETDFINFLKKDKLINSKEITQLESILDILLLEKIAKFYQYQTKVDHRSASFTADYLIAALLTVGRDHFKTSEKLMFLNTKGSSNNDYLAAFGESEETLVKEKILRKELRSKYGFNPFRGLYETTK